MKLITTHVHEQHNARSEVYQTENDVPFIVVHRNAHGDEAGVATATTLEEALNVAETWSNGLRVLNG